MIAIWPSFGFFANLRNTVLRANDCVARLPAGLLQQPRRHIAVSCTVHALRPGILHEHFSGGLISVYNPAQ
jgi:hypothetical protein